MYITEHFVLVLPHAIWCSSVLHIAAVNIPVLTVCYMLSVQLLILQADVMYVDTQQLLQTFAWTEMSESAKYRALIRVLKDASREFHLESRGRWVLSVWCFNKGKTESQDQSYFGWDVSHCTLLCIKTVHQEGLSHSRRPRTQYSFASCLFLMIGLPVVLFLIND